MGDVLVERGVPREKIALAYNWVAPETMSDQPERHAARRSYGISDDEFVVTYAGTVGAAQGLRTLVLACAELRMDRHIRVMVAGDGIELSGLRQLARELSCSSISFLGRVSFAEMPAVYAASDIQLISLVDDPIFAVTMPSKMQSALAIGQPILVMAPGDAADVARRSGAGWSVRAGDFEGLAMAMREAARCAPSTLAEMGAAGRCYYEEHMSERVGSSRLDRALRDACKISRG